MKKAVIEFGLERVNLHPEWPCAIPRLHRDGDLPAALTPYIYCVHVALQQRLIDKLVASCTFQQAVDECLSHSHLDKAGHYGRYHLIPAARMRFRYVIPPSQVIGWTSLLGMLDSERFCPVSEPSEKGN
jgi:hypothetical protein